MGPGAHVQAQIHQRVFIRKWPFTGARGQNKLKAPCKRTGWNSCSNPIREGTLKSPGSWSPVTSGFLIQAGPPGGRELSTTPHLLSICQTASPALDPKISPPGQKHRQMLSKRARDIFPVIRPKSLPLSDQNMAPQSCLPLPTANNWFLTFIQNAFHQESKINSHRLLTAPKLRMHATCWFYHQNALDLSSHRTSNQTLTFF